MLHLTGYVFLCSFVTLLHAQQNNLTDIDLSENSRQHQLVWAVKRRNPIQILSRSTLLATHADPAAAVESGSLDSIVLVNGQIGSEFWALGSDYQRRKIYYSDYKGNFIGVLNSVNRTHETVFHGLSFGIDAISVDWYTGNVYWVDTDLNNIFVADTTFKYVTKLQNIDSDVPGKLAVDPIRGVMYWSERDEKECRIYSSNLDGTGANLLHNFTDTLSIDEITIDFNEQRLYFAERLRTTFGSSQIRYFNLNTPNNVETLLSRTLTWVTGLASYKNVLYVSNRFGRNTIYIYNKTTGGIIQNYQHDSREVLRSAMVYGPDIQPWTFLQQQRHQCNNSPCSHICLPTTINNRGFVCRCSDGFTLADDQASCFSKPVLNNFLLWSEGRNNNILQLSLDSPDNVALLDIKNRRTPRSIHYDPIQQQVYWSDPLSGTISRADLDGSNQEVVFDNVPTFAIGLDIASRTIYIANSATDFMLVGSMDLPNITTTLHVNNIYTVFEIKVSHRLRKVFWCDGGPTSGGRNFGRIESMNLDGSGRTIVANLTKAPNSLAVDDISNFVYWTQVFSDKIYWLDMNGGISGEYVVLQSSNQARIQPVRGAYYFNHSIYVTSVTGAKVYKLATETILLNNTEVVPETIGTETLFSVSSLTFYSNASEPQDLTSCTVNRGGCPEICVPSPTSTPTCLCADHSIYVSQNNSCTQVYLKEDTERPTFGNTCPRTITILQVNDCETTATFDFERPTATDNSGRVVVTTTVIGNPPYNLTAGLHFFSYRANDYHGNSASCRFYVTVRDQRCVRSPFIPTNSITSPPTCGSSVGSVINVTCTTNNRASFQYVCNPNGIWLPSTLPICLPETTTTTTTTTTQSTTTTSLSTTNVPPLASKSVSFVTDGSESDGNAEKSQLLTTAGQNVQAPVQTSTLDGGLVALIVILVILLIVAVVFLVYRFGRNSMAFKHVLWTRNQDHVTLREEESNVQYRGMNEQL